MTVSELHIGQGTVGVTAQPVTLAFQMQRHVLIKADAGNTGTIFIGGPSVTAALGWPLAAGEEVPLETDVSKIGICADAADQKYSYLLT